MAVSRTQFIEWQSRVLDGLFALAPGEDETRQRFERLVMDTYDHLSAQGAGVLPLKLETTASSLPHGKQLSAELLQRWQDWERDYRKLLERNPRLELHDMLHAISESDTASSWPVGYERRIQDWVDSGGLADVPFTDRNDIVTPKFFARLRELRRRIGGWLYWNDEVKRVVFAPEPEWQKVRVAQDARAAELKKQRQRQRRVRELVNSAVGDAAFWAELKDREQEIQQISPGAPEIQPKLEAVDELFERFLARALGEGCDIAIGELISELRRQAIREIHFGERESATDHTARAFIHVGYVQTPAERNTSSR